jgi:hypothetical protein
MILLITQVLIGLGFCYQCFRLGEERQMRRDLAKIKKARLDAGLGPLSEAFAECKQNIATHIAEAKHDLTSPYRDSAANEIEILRVEIVTLKADNARLRRSEAVLLQITNLTLGKK